MSVHAWVCVGFFFSFISFLLMNEKSQTAVRPLDDCWSFTVGSRGNKTQNGSSVLCGLSVTDVLLLSLNKIKEQRWGIEIDRTKHSALNSLLFQKKSCSEKLSSSTRVCLHVELANMPIVKRKDLHISRCPKLVGCLQSFYITGRDYRK